MLSQKERKKQVERLTACATEKHGEQRNRKARPPLEQLILGMLYEVTSVRRGTRALNEIKRSFVDWNEVRVSHPVEVAGVLSTASWARDGAERVVWLLREVFARYNHTNLDFLTELTPAQARSSLKGMSSVPRHLAEEILLFSLDVPALPCSPDAARMCFRLGLIESDRATVKNQRALAKLVPEDMYATVHLFLVDFAGKVCLADEPLCPKCPMRKSCPSSST